MGNNSTNENWLPKVDELWKVVDKKEAKIFAFKGKDLVESPDLLKEDPVFLVIACEPRHLKYENAAITSVIGDDNVIIFAKRNNLQKVS
jgi:hypothetical protein